MCVQGVCECAMMKFEQSAATMERVVELYKRNLHKEHPTLSSAQRLAGHCNLKVAARTELPGMGTRNLSFLLGTSPVLLGTHRSGSVWDRLHP